ncbi:helix-turn-helix domain-containing protein [Spirosoma sp. KCTC 42546]|uniref:helix-turn-helix domain-containing protein n=1 Tax=Spirosoma sp. KCTC 42546 TaxID=2520506 RepID=UPI0011594226|nr:helix-turn-helix domain-containing protein [Spirosoma sp. KCTC 42546]QDK77156.1 helix-turn-helix domain-containing protein [Spirosoma sp. KCTC 42546]
MITTNSIVIENLHPQVINNLVDLIANINSKIDLLLNKDISNPVKFITKKDVAIIFGVSTRTVANWTELGLIQSYYMGGLIVYKEHEINAAPIPVFKNKN